MSSCTELGKGHTGHLVMKRKISLSLQSEISSSFSQHPIAGGSAEGRFSHQQGCAGVKWGCWKCLRVTAILMPLSDPVTQFWEEIRIYLGALWPQPSPGKTEEEDGSSWETDGEVWTEAAPVPAQPSQQVCLCHPHVKPGCLLRPWVVVGSPGDKGNFPSAMFGQEPIGFCLGVSSCCSNPRCSKLCKMMMLPLHVP